MGSLAGPLDLKIRLDGWDEVAARGKIRGGQPEV